MRKKGTREKEVKEALKKGGTDEERKEKKCVSRVWRRRKSK